MLLLTVQSIQFGTDALPSFSIVQDHVDARDTTCRRSRYWQGRKVRHRHELVSCGVLPGCTNGTAGDIRCIENRTPIRVGSEGVAIAMCCRSSSVHVPCSCQVMSTCATWVHKSRRARGLRVSLSRDPLCKDPCTTRIEVFRTPWASVRNCRLRRGRHKRHVL